MRTLASVFILTIVLGEALGFALSGKWDFVLALVPLAVFGVLFGTIAALIKQQCRAHRNTYTR